MVEKGEIMTCTYKTIGGISPFSTINGGSWFIQPQSPNTVLTS